MIPVAIHDNHQRYASLTGVLLLLLCGCLSFTASAIEKIYYYHNDHLGSPVAMSDQSGTVVWRADYQPFGETTTTGSIANTHGYIGKEKDPETGLYYVGARYYDPNTGRFLSIDPILATSSQGSNRYGYALNNPYRYTDPTGLQSSEHDYSEYEFPIYIPSVEDSYIEDAFLQVGDLGGIAAAVKGVVKLGVKLGVKAGSALITSNTARRLISLIDNEAGSIGRLFADDDLILALGDIDPVIPGDMPKFPLSNMWKMGGRPDSGFSWIGTGLRPPDEQAAFLLESYLKYEKGMIRFDLQGIKDIGQVLANQGPYADAYTGAELRYLMNNWDRFRGRITFYDFGIGPEPVNPPW